MAGKLTLEELRAAVARCAEEDVLGVNSQVELAVAERIFQEKRRRKLMAVGVTMMAPDTVFLSWDTEIGAGGADRAERCFCNRS